MEALAGVVFEAPLALAPGPERRPLLAEEQPSFEAGTLRLDPFTVEFKLRKGVAFSDGERLTSADVRWTYEGAAQLARDLGPAAPYPGFERLERVETPDGSTARLVFEEPYARWRDLLTAPILPRHRHEDEDFARIALDEGATGSGPFVLQQRSEDTLEFSGSPSYWANEEPPLPNLEGIEVRFGSAGALASGEAELGLLTPRAEGMLPSGELLSARASPSRVERLMFNAREGPLEDPGTREAIAEALDRNRLASVAGAPVAQSFVPDIVPGHVPAWEGYAGGEERADGPVPAGPLLLVYPETPGGDQVREEVATEVVSQLRSTGIEVEAQPLKQAEFYGEALPRGDFDMALYASNYPEAHETLRASIPPQSGAALEATLAAASDDEQEETLAAAQATLARERALLPLFVWPDAYAWSSTLSGPQPETPRDAILWNVREWGFYE